MSDKRRRYRSRSAISTLSRRDQAGFRGYPIATVAYYGPDNMFASKVAVGIILEEGKEVAFLERWFSETQDVRTDPVISQQVVEFIAQHRAKSVAMTDRIIGCPHEEGKDYPLGENCPQCPYWANRDRWTGGAVDGEDQQVKVITGCAWYRAEQWDRLREVSADRDRLEETYAEWVTNAEKSLRKMRQMGICAEKIEIDVDELLAWCRAREQEVDGAARARYVAEIVGQRYKGDNRESGG